MNTFLQGCCFIAPEDDSISTPSFLDRTPRFLPPSRSSIHFDTDVNFPESKEIFYIKRCTIEAWADSEDEKTSSTKTSLDVFSGGSKSTATERLKRRKRVSSSNRSLKFNEDNVSEHMSYWLCGTNAQHPKDCSAEYAQNAQYCIRQFKTQLFPRDDSWEKTQIGPYINHLVAECNKGLNCPRKTYILFYKAYARIWYESASPPLLQKIDIVETKALRICMEAICLTPIEPLHPYLKINSSLVLLAS
ncbi:hypothetical protein ILUMI_03423 [Ignelater luminosus]|uniref:Uncharacterized protein n=1 Tax=Ignelater luminosus TaxID=2038154 RepID=A0A8K0GM67_IGNLU|nr:hypothetical protein ILUMI_03423 [Ignelater luminosus]